MHPFAHRIKEIIASHPDVRVNVAALKDDTRLRDVDADGLVLVDVTLELEDEFAIAFHRDEIDYETVGELIATVERKLADKLPRAARVA